MLKLTFCLRRLPGMTREAFQDYWATTHAEIMRRNKKALGFRRYVQSHTIGGDLAEKMERSRGGPEAFDGVAEIWWDSEAELLASLSTPEGRAAGRELIEDEKNFIDMANSPVWLSEARVEEVA